MIVNIPLGVEITRGSISASKCPSDMACAHLSWDFKANSSCSSREIRHEPATTSAVIAMTKNKMICNYLNLPVLPIWTCANASVSLKE